VYNNHGLRNIGLHVVVCSSGSDRTWVISELLPTLENAPERFRLCLHERDFILGSYITHNIVDSMQHSRQTVVVLTNSFVRSQVLPNLDSPK
jgi:hypothetical protein